MQSKWDLDINIQYRDYDWQYCIVWLKFANGVDLISNALNHRKGIGDRCAYVIDGDDGLIISQPYTYLQMHKVVYATYLHILYVNCISAVFESPL
jgi:hypothetical protein